MFVTFAAFAAFTLTTAIPFTPRSTGCDNPSTRQEWRALTSTQKSAYIEAVQCMASKPSQLGLSTTHYDDFPYIHNVLNNDIHFVASFLPWHRYFVQIYENSLKDCGFTGSMPYWDWTLDSSSPSESPIWDALTGFGGNGNASHIELSYLRCVEDGPFSTLRPAYFGSSHSQHCLARRFNAGGSDIGTMLGEYYSPSAVVEVQVMSNFTAFAYGLEGGPHGAVHSGIGGDMSPSTSPNDPIFFLHHTQIDRLWYLWQQESPETRMLDYAGNKTQYNEGGVDPVAASLTDVLSYIGLAVDLVVSDVMNTTSSLLCYNY